MYSTGQEDDARMYVWREGKEDVHMYVSACA